MGRLSTVPIFEGVNHEDGINSRFDRMTLEEPLLYRDGTVPYSLPTAMIPLLIVDDSKVMRDMVAACLRPLDGVAFEFAASGLEAIERLSLKEFALVVLDLNMPDIGGVEVVEFIRSQDRLRRLPILIVTTRGDEVSRQQVLAAGASRYMTKPFTPEAILHEVRGLLGSPAAR